jgi:hypothetical protein
MPNERGIEERRGFERILVGKVGPDQQPPIFAQRVIGEQVAADALESFQEKVVEPTMISRN